MKRTIKLSVIILVLAVLLAVFAVTMAACNKDKEQSVSADYSKYAGKYYEVQADKLSEDSWFELKADGTWINGDSENGTFKIDGNDITLYSQTGNVQVFSGYITDGEMSLNISGEYVVFIFEKKFEGAYSVTFNANGGSSQLATKYYKEGELLADLPIPTRSGYTFLNWMDDMGNIYDRTSVMPARDLRLTAVWKKQVSTYEDDYVTFRPATEGWKNSSIYNNYRVDEYVYVEITSNDLGGRQNVGRRDNFKLADTNILQYSVNDGYTWNWYQGDFSKPNGAQRFTLGYGSNIQLVTISNGSGIVVRTYLVDIYVLHDYKVDFYKNVIFNNNSSTEQPFNTCWVIENELLPENLQRYTENTNLTPTGFLYKNSNTGMFENYELTTPVTRNLNLYQAYEDIKLDAVLDDGSLDGELIIKPYMQFVQLPVPTKEGYDFIGWKLDDGKYFADITGNTTINYISQDNFFGQLTAEWREKRYYEKWDGDEVTFVPTVPYVTYTDAAHTVIKKIEYMPEGYGNIPEGIYIAVGEQLVATESNFCRWTVDGKKISDGAEYTIKASDLDKTFRKEKHVMGEWIIDGEYKCEDTVTRYKDCANCEYTKVEENYIVPHTWKEQLTGDRQKECTKCGYKENVYEERDGKIYFGEYPQTRETDDGITATLTQMSGDRPVRGNSGEWTDYEYYINGSTSEYMWYIDLDYGGEKYRGVYFTSYRSNYTTDGSPMSHTYQYDNGYFINTLYWFKWEPIEWRVLEKTDGEAFLMSNFILDSQQYYRTDSGMRNIDGKTVYPNNYKESDIRAWLNGTFYNWAFDNVDQSIIKITLVDNSASTTSSSSNNYACENTNDKVFLLSNKDVINTSYGFNSRDKTYDTARRWKTTGYAQSQGAYTSTENDFTGNYSGNGWWWLRSPSYTYSDCALYVSYFGYADSGCVVNGTDCGVVPAIKIQL